MELIILNPDLALFTLRLSLGIFLLAHGPFKIFYPQEIDHQIKLSTFNIVSLGILETLAAISLILGIEVFFSSLLVVLIMLSLIYIKTRHKDAPFTGPYGWELEFMTLAAALTVFLAGSGSITLF